MDLHHSSSGRPVRCHSGYIAGRHRWTGRHCSEGSRSGGGTRQSSAEEGRTQQVRRNGERRQVYRQMHSRSSQMRRNRCPGQTDQLTGPNSGLQGQEASPQNCAPATAAATAKRQASC